MATVTAPPQRQGIVLNASWEAYVVIGELLRDQPIRMNYDRGRLEIMTVSHEHEWLKRLLGSMLVMLFIAQKIRFHSGGSTTFQREALDRGLEPDECYWIQHEEQMRGKSTFDPDLDPPPDLALEVEVSRSVLNRLGIFAALGIPEVWRYDGESIRVLLLDAEGTYQASSESKALPMVPVAELARFLERRHTTDELDLFSEFLGWAREQQAAEPGAKKPRGRKKK
jgi:Uma2 family endonuclease